MRKYVILVLVLSFIVTSVMPQSKIALVIGNSDYKQMPLKNPENDAYDLSSALRALGFQVIQKTNLNQRQMEDAIREFKGSISPGDVALFYFSGHGTQVKGLNYLIPVGERVTNEIDVKYNCVEAGFVLDHMEQARSGINIIILDACRNNPFKGYRSANRGFAYMSAPTGSIIAYSTAPGKVAQDGAGRNSPFTKNLIEKINISGLKIEEVFKEVRKDVAGETGRQQIPWESSSLMGDFYFNSASGDKPNVSNQYTNENERKQISKKESYQPKRKPEPHESFTGKSGTFTDIRDGQKYKWVRIGDQIWMAENLNFKADNSSIYSKSLEEDRSYGRLYTWEAASSACPIGWHLSSYDEWQVLLSDVGGDISKLKSKEGWHKNRNGTDEFGFNVLPGGYYIRMDLRYFRFGKVARFWTSRYWGKEQEGENVVSSYKSVHKYCYFSIYSRGKKISWSRTSEYNKCSVRCIKDE